MNTIVNFAGIEVDNITLDEAAASIELFIAAGKPHLVVTPNPEMIVTAQEDKELLEIINAADLRLPDGISMVVVSRILGNPLKERVSGIDLMLKLCEKASVAGWKIFLLGGQPGIAAEAADKLKIKYPALNIAGIHHGYFEESGKVIQAIKDARPDILFVGLGAGRQEKWLHHHLKDLNVPVGMAMGGSLDVISGKKQRAPRWIQSLYIEWLYRLITEPNRWKRQLALPKFLYLTLIRKML